MDEILVASVAAGSFSILEVKYKLIILRYLGIYTVIHDLRRIYYVWST